MITFLTSLAQLSSTRNLLLISQKGRVLFARSRDASVIDDAHTLIWKGLISTLGFPQSAQFHYNLGLYYIIRTKVGFLIVGLKDDAKLDDVRSMCAEIGLLAEDTRERKKALLQILMVAEDTLKVQVVNELSSMVDEEVVQGLVPMLEGYSSFSRNMRDRLLLALCQVLGNSSSPLALVSLRRFLKHYIVENENANPGVARAAKVSIKQLQLQNRNDRLGQVVEEDSEVETRSGTESYQTAHYQTAARAIPGTGEKEGGGPGMDRRASTEELHVMRLVAEGKKEEAAAIIMKYIEAAARQRKFGTAERLRDKLIEIDPMLLTEIIRAAEIIEEEKTAAIDPDHLALWQNLVEKLSPEEFAVLYHAMMLNRCANGEIVVKQGTFLSQLIFVNSGQIKVFAEAEGKDVYLKTVGPGEVMGGEIFFEASVWTVKGVSQGVEYFALPRKKMELLAEQWPSLESKLIDFSAQFTCPCNLFRRTKQNRRRFARKNVSGRAVVYLLDREGNDTGLKFKGYLFDISPGGLSVCARVARKKNAHMLFGGKVRTAIPASAEARTTYINRTGIIVAVRGHHLVSNEYSVHVQFDDLLSTTEIQQVGEGG